MSADELRRAAEALRTKAGAASSMTGSGDWFAAPLPSPPNEWRVRSSGGTVARDTSAEEADYIVTMHPGVGLALADWLDSTAERIEGRTKTRRGGKYDHLRDAFILARLINGVAAA